MRVFVIVVVVIVTVAIVTIVLVVHQVAVLEPLTIALKHSVDGEDLPEAAAHGAQHLTALAE